LIDPARITVEPAGRFEVTAVAYLCVDPVVQFLDAVVLLGIKDHSHEIRLAPNGHAYEVRMAVQDKIHELKPAPNWLANPVAQAVKAIAGMDAGQCDRREEGHIHITCGGHDVPTDVVVEPTEFGPKVTLRFVCGLWSIPCRCASCLSARGASETASNC
jgi:type II secretory ATPase GspE/PulE/Tfp pilus assembly ATPase PilB-like protein